MTKAVEEKKKAIPKDTMAVMLESIERTVNQTITSLKKAGLMKDGSRSVFQKTESLLYNYPKFKKIIEERREILKDDDFNHGKSKSVVAFSKTASHTNKTEEEQYRERFEAYEASVAKTESYVRIIGEALKKIENDPYYQVLPLKYWEWKTHQEIADLFSKDVSTITRNKTRLINELKINLFSDEAIEELFV